MPSPEAVATAVARNVRTLRTSRGWSLDQLATRSGVSKGMLVHLEQARTNPSLSTLCKLAETLGISLAGLVELHDTPRVQLVAPDDVVRLWSTDAGSHGDVLAGSDLRDHVELWSWQIAAGDARESTSHLRGTREMVHVLDGSLTLDVAGESYEVLAGGAAVFDAHMAHQYRNTGRKAVKFVLVVLTPDPEPHDPHEGI